MSALLTAEIGNQDKLTHYLAECKDMDIGILPPDVNSSGLAFTPAGNAIRFGLTAIKNVGVTAIEAGRTNVCGLAPESFLSRVGFEYDAIMMYCPALADRLKALRRVTSWFSTGPLRYGQAFEYAGSAYPAGDALSFVDPFTGSGLLAAVRSGAMAGRAAAIGLPVPEYLRQCRASLRQPFQVAGVLRRALEGGWAEKLAPLAPGRLLFALTRPK
jgi:hypothetical protein